MDNYKPNSHRSKEEQKQERKFEKVVSGKTKTKKNEMRKFKDIFISEDVGNVKSYIFMDVLVPAIKKAVCDIVKDGVDMILYGGSKRSSGSSGSKVSYRSYYDDRHDKRPSEPRESTRFDYDDIVYEYRGDAEAVLTQMKDAIKQYGLISVADMYDMANEPAPYTGFKYGWTSINTAEIVRVRDGYIIKLPKAIPID